MESNSAKVLAKNGTAMMAAGAETLAVALGMDEKQALDMVTAIMTAALGQMKIAGKLDRYNAMAKR